MNRTGNLTRPDWLLALGLFLLSLALRIPFRSHFTYHWDSAEFALAINDYNVGLSQPHVPGYFLYVMLGRLVNGLIGDPNASLVWISAVFGSGLVAILHLLGTRMFDRRTGLAAALFAMTSPQCWFHSCVALMYVVDAFLVCGLVWLCWDTIQRGGTWKDAVLIGIGLAVAGGVRQQTVPGMLPLVLFTFWKARETRFAKLALAGAISILGAAAWFFPMAQMSGGVQRFLEIVRHFSRFVSRDTVLRRGSDAFLANLTNVLIFLWIALLLAAVLITVGLFYRAFRLSTERRQAWDREHGLAMAVLAWWIAPMILLTTVVAITDQPGHVFSYLPAFFLLAGVVAARLQSQWLYAAVVGLICVVNSLAFLAWPTAWNGLLFHRERTAQEIRRDDELFARIIPLVRSQFRPEDTLICHADEFFQFGMRQFQVYLPEYDQFLFLVDWAMASQPDKPMLGVREGRLEFLAAPPLPGKRQVLLVVPPPAKVRIFREFVDLNAVRPVTGADGTLFTVPVAAIRTDAVARAQQYARQQQEKAGL